MSGKTAGLWESLGRSFEPGFYRRIADQEFGRSLLYLFLLSVIVSFALSLTFSVNLYRSTLNIRSWVRTHIEEIWPSGVTKITIVNGGLSSDGPQPVVHKWGKDFAFIIDPEGKAGSLDGYGQGLLLAKNKFVFKSKKPNGGADTREGGFSVKSDINILRADAAKEEIARVTVGKNSLIVGPATVDTFLNLMVALMFVFMSFAIFLGNLAVKLMQAAVLAVIPLLLGPAFKTQLPYKSAFNISIYALTPAVIVSLLVSVATNLKFALPMPVYLALYVIYAALALKHMKEPAAN